MFSRQNPPKFKSLVRQGVSEFVKHDFGRDEDGNLIVVEAGKVDYRKLADASAEGCDYYRLQQILKEATVKEKASLDLDTCDPNLRYGDTSDFPTDAVGMADKLGKANKAAMDAYSKVPEDLKGKSIEDFAKNISQEQIRDYILKTMIKSGEIKLGEGDKKDE